MEDVLEKLFDILTRIEKQNSEILVALAPKASRKHLSVEEAAERLGRSPWTIRQLCNSGQIRAVKGNDGCWKIPADEVARLEEEGVPTLPKRPSRTDAASPLASLRKQDASIVASSAPSYAQAG
ncbi:MAG: helix-turn-helix domain-containing protein [Pirellulales bacterium]|nr:helix-turn-helix domain-containing protein [Pirellulales bacterium]